MSIGFFWFKAKASYTKIKPTVETVGDEKLKIQNSNSSY
jgi:hypothetical protein